MYATLPIATPSKAHLHGYPIALQRIPVLCYDNDNIDRLSLYGLDITATMRYHCLVVLGARDTVILQDGHVVDPNTKLDRGAEYDVRLKLHETHVASASIFTLSQQVLNPARLALPADVLYPIYYRDLTPGKVRSSVPKGVRHDFDTEAYDRLSWRDEIRCRVSGASKLSQYSRRPTFSFTPAAEVQCAPVLPSARGPDVRCFHLSLHIVRIPRDDMSIQIFKLYINRRAANRMPEGIVHLTSFYNGFLLEKTVHTAYDYKRVAFIPVKILTLPSFLSGVMLIFSFLFLAT